ncbi:MAG: hypothetical protein P1U88_14895 [Thalassobaculaceae bacterium]|nr:hypothetical protein [Thalassobaculaceae bacterium]
MTGDPLTAERKAALHKLFDQAVQLHVSGNVLAAAQAYEQLLKDIPNHADVLDLYGTALFQLGAAEHGRAYVAASLKRRPIYGPAWNHLGAIDRSLRDDPAAEGAFRRSILLDPGRAEALVNLAAIFGDRDQTAVGLALTRKALMAFPQSPDAVLRQGVLLRRAGRPAEAIPPLEAAWKRQIGNTEIALNLARANVDLGHLATARRVVMMAIALSPETHELYGSLATSHDPRWSTDRDVAWARAATILRPLDARNWLNLCAETYRDGRIDTAFEASRRTLMLEPGSDMGMRNLASAAINRHELAYCRAVSRRVLVLEPDNADAQYTLAEVEFRIGDAKTAWDLHEARIRRDVHRPRLNVPASWQGPGTETGPLLIASEQGVGDEVTFLSCLAEMYERITQPVVIEVDKRLIPLIARTFPSATVVPRQFVPGDGLGQFLDYKTVTAQYGIHQFAYSGSLPRILGRDRDRPLERVGYLQPDPGRVAHWRDWLATLGGGKTIGMVWRTAQWTRFRARIHCSIEDLFPVLATPGCTFINLMVGNNAEDLAKVKAATGVEMIRPPGLDIWENLDDLSALMRALDAVVSARTANCAFAGAVGTPTVRLAQGFLYVSNGREFFFPNVHPVFDRDEAFDGPEAGRRAAAMLARLVAPASAG